MKKFAAYLDKNYRFDAEFAAFVGASKQDVSRWRSGARIPCHEMMCTIQDLTNGAISIEDWVRFDAGVPAKKSVRGGKRNQGFSQGQPQGI